MRTLQAKGLELRDLEDHRELDDSLAALFKAVDAPKPLPGFTSRTMRAVRREPLPAGRRPLRHPLVVPVGCAAAVVVATASVYFVLATQPAVAESFAWLLATAPEASLRQADEAVRVAEHAADLTDRYDSAVLDILAAAYAAAGQFDRAVTVSQAALDLKPSAPLEAAIRKRQGLYAQRQPYVAPAGPSGANVP